MKVQTLFKLLAVLAIVALLTFTVSGAAMVLAQGDDEADPVRPAPPPVLVDSDGDGVADSLDQCPNTPLGAAVDANGCAVKAPPEAVPEDGPEAAPKAPPEAVPEGGPEAPPKAPPEAPPKAPPDAPPKAPPEAPPEAPPDAPPEAPPEAVPEDALSIGPVEPPKLPAATSASGPDLIAGQHIDVGDVSVWDDGVNLYVQYNTDDGWCLTETHLHVATSLEDIPQRNGNPPPGKFEYKNEHDCVTDYTYPVYPVDLNGEELFIAAHAEVCKQGKGCETAWGAGLDFPGKNWATYFTYTLDQYQTESAWGEGELIDGGPAMYFWVSILCESGGGYAQGVLTTVTLLAGQTIDAGTVTVAVEGENLVVTYATKDGWELLETHLYVDTMPPSQSAPEQFPCKHEDLGGVTTDQYIISVPWELGIECPDILYLAAHATVQKDLGGGQ